MPLSIGISKRLSQPRNYPISVREIPKFTHKHIAEVKRSHRIETCFRSSQLHLWQLSQTQWLLALRRREPIARKKPGKIVPLANQLPLPFDATG